MDNHPLAGHLGVTKTIKAISFSIIPAEEVSDYIRHCPGCQLQTTHIHNPPGLLQPLGVAPHAWHAVTTDYIIGLPSRADGHCH